jgi:hypothetical protein
MAKYSTKGYREPEEEESAEGEEGEGVGAE